MPTELRRLSIPEKLKVVMEVQDYLHLSPEQYRQLLLHVIRSNLEHGKTPDSEDEQNAA